MRLNEGIGLIWMFFQNVGSPNWISQCQTVVSFDDLGVTQFYENITMGIKQHMCIFTKKMLTILLWFLFFPQLRQVF